jgi:sigma-B regulation protein RsbU (phosphoserine phosphatase)
MKRTKPPVFQYVCLGVLFAIACGYQVRATIAAFPSFFSPNSAQWPFHPDYVNGKPVAEFVRTEGQQAGLHENDVLVAINGRAFTGTAVFGEALASAKPGDKLEVAARTPGAENTRTVTIALARPEKPTGWAVASVFLLKVGLPFFSILLGFWVALVRPRDRLAWLLLGVLLGVSNLFSANVESWGPIVRDAAETYRTLCNSAWPLFMMYFGLYFPEPFSGGRTRWVARIATIAFPPALIISGIVAVILRVGEMENFASVARLYEPWSHVSPVATVFEIGATSCFFAFVATKMGQSVSPDAKRRLRLLYAGTTAAMSPTFLLVLLNSVFGGGELEKRFPEWLVLAALSLILLFPVTLAYTIVVQRALDVRVVLRQGLRYGLATGGIRVLQVLLTFAVLWGAITLSLDPSRNRPRKITAIAWGVVLVLWVRKGSDKVRTWTDRRFFRESYDTERVLEGLSDEVRTIVETRPLLERVATRIAESLHVPRVAVLLADGGSFRPAYALGYTGVPEADLLDTGVTVQRLLHNPEPSRVYFDDEDSWVNSPELTDDERRKLVALAPQLLLPLSVKEKLLGIISLGEKRSEAPYSGTDLRLLKSVAVQTGLALANAQLTNAIAQEVARSAKMSREVEIAREVQERLFPQRMPKVPGLDCCGRCRTALGVGGDYYDFLALPDGRLGVALGDVSGKGIAAALTMASLQASLRADATRAGNDIAGLVTRVNQMVYDASAEDRYATFFYAEYNPATRRLVYVNGGHCAPMLFRHLGAGRTVERLDQGGGPVVGLMPDCPYEQAEVLLAPGDSLVIYTDGISEAMNRDLEEWGEDRLKEAVQSCTGLNSEETIARIMQAADAYAAGAPQHDDMTLVVLRVLPN